MVAACQRERFVKGKSNCQPREKGVDTRYCVFHLIYMLMEPLCPITKKVKTLLKYLSPKVSYRFAPLHTYMHEYIHTYVQALHYPIDHGQWENDINR